MEYTTLRRNGGWCVELVQPLQSNSGQVDAIEITPPRLSHVTRWTSNEIKSSMALLAELSNQPEVLFKGLTYPDVDRVLMAFAAVMPPSIRSDFEQGKKPLFTPEEFRDETEERYVPDAHDPRFPSVDGPVKRFVDPGPPRKPEADDFAVGPDPNEGLRAVG